MASEVVRLNVGGTKYELPRSLIERYPNTMLARLISDTWLKDPTSDVFIDRNGFRFQFVLDFMRDQKVCLPMNIPKPSMLQELQYYGFENVPSEAVNESHASFEAATLMADFSKRHGEFLKTRTDKIHDLERELVYEIVAFECFKHYALTGSLTGFGFWNDDHPHYEDMERHDQMADQPKLDKFLFKYGLQCDPGMQNWWDLSSVVHFKLRAIVATGGS